jgi:TRAP-type C4-dicarboxylate transport system permease small subunit
MKNKTARSIVATICILVIAIVAIGYGSYFYWTTRGDVVDLSTTGGLG